MACWREAHQRSQQPRYCSDLLWTASALEGFLKSSDRHRERRLRLKLLLVPVGQGSASPGALEVFGDSPRAKGSAALRQHERSSDSLGFEHWARR